jgi:hypothetical protein
VNVAVPRWLLDPVVLMAAVVTVAVGSIAGAQGTDEDIDGHLFRSVILQMQDGEGFYESMVVAIEEKEGKPPSQVRSIRTPPLATALEPFPEGSWRALAAIPALALCLTAGALAGPGIRSRQVAVVLTGLWMVVSLPLLYLHQELWGAPLLMGGVLAFRARREGWAAVLCAAAAAVRELFVLSLLAGLVLGRRRRPWLVALAVVAVAGYVHAQLAQDVLDPNGFDPPLKALELFLTYLSPGKSGAVSMTLGVLLLVAAAVGLWRHRDRRELWFAAASLGPVLVAGAYGGRSYWTLTWCAAASACAALAIEPPRTLAGGERVRDHHGAVGGGAIPGG